MGTQDSKRNTNILGFIAPVTPLADSATNGICAAPNAVGRDRAMIAIIHPIKWHQSQKPARGTIPEAMEALAQQLTNIAKDVRSDPAGAERRLGRLVDWASTEAARWR